jgi:DNA helicase-2/ATP-dependent DNA helicase PcrA
MHHNTDLIGVDKEIYSYLNLDDPKSFLLFAGAGSGKTRTLVNVLQEIRNKDLSRFIQKGQRIAVITYTNAACEEIQHRLKYDPIFNVSTIHSFIWDLIKPFSVDIKEWLRIELKDKISELSLKIGKARNKEGKTAIKNARSKMSKQRRLNELDVITDFTYSPTSNKSEKGTLSHADVIKIGAHFIDQHMLMRKVLTNRFPILLIDESQDTNKALLEAFISTQQANKDQFSLGLFGDMMQRIYSGGKDDLDNNLPDDWKSPAKMINYRCPKRIVSLINRVRNDADKKVQTPKKDANEGSIRLFIIDSKSTEKLDFELKARKHMLEVTSDHKWDSKINVNTLILEHAMAAVRGDFYEFFMPLSRIDRLRDAALNGTSRDFKFITDLLLPLINAIKNNEQFDIVRIINRNSYLLSSDNNDFITDPIAVLNYCDRNVESIKDYLNEKPEITLKDILKLINRYSLLVIPDNLSIHLDDMTEVVNEELEEDSNLVSDEFRALDEALDASLEQVNNYSKYVSEQLGFSTHQGVKGLEFERVMAILDDKESKGFLFSYEKLFGAKELSQKDIDNENDGIDSAIARTRRLFYVICSRAEKSLAVVAYTTDPETVKKKAIESQWFTENEVVFLC